MPGLGAHWEKKRNEAPLRFGSFRGSEPLKPKIQQAIVQIKALNSKLESSLFRFGQMDAQLFKRVVNSSSKHERARAAMYANELAEVRKITKYLTHVRVALETITLRLETFQDVGDFVSTVAPAMVAIKSLSKGLTEIVPEASNTMSEISNELTSLMSDAGTTSKASIDFEVVNKDAEEILAQAYDAAEQQMKGKFPELVTTFPAREAESEPA
jgi:division protein CdvB (Snf7/Vps24/ESCRT-III family)